LEQSCRNPKPTLLNASSHQHFVELQAAVRAVTFEELLTVLAS
jgi:hypothetical protein